MAHKKSSTNNSIVNKRARFDYELKDSIIAGIVLTGAETKSLRMGHGHLRGAFANIKDGELWLYNSTINATNLNRKHLTPETESRGRKLLVKKKQLAELIAAKDQGLTIIPVRILTKGNFIKVEIAVGRGMKKYDKRDKIKKRDTDRDTARAMARN